MFRVYEKHGGRCYVVSAKYGIIDCEEEIEPYDVYLASLSPHQLEILKKKISKRCYELKGPWNVVVTNLSSKYSRLLDCNIVAEKALVIGSKPVNLKAEKVVIYKFRTIGQQYHYLSKLEELLESLQEL